MSKSMRVIHLLIVCANILILTGCWDGRQPEDLAYVINVGLDKGTKYKINLTLQVAVPRNIVSGGSSSNSSSSSSSSGGSGGKSVNVVSIETRTITSGLEMANEFVNKKVSLAHIKAIVMSEEFAREAGMSKHLDFFNRYRECRGTVSMIVVRKGKASEFIKMLNAVFESNMANHMESIISLHNVSSNVPSATLKDFYCSSKSYDDQPIAMLAGINNKVASNESTSTSNKSASSEDRAEANKDNKNKGTEGNMQNTLTYLPGEIPRMSEEKDEFAGTAIFDGDKMVGEFNGLETFIMMNLRNEHPNRYYSVQDPLRKDSYVVVDLKQRKSPKIYVYRKGDKCDINITLRMQGNILAIQSGIGYEDKKYMPILEKHIQKNVKEACEKVIKKAQAEYKCDVFKLGNHVRSTFMKQKQWEQFNWKNKFANANIKVNVEFCVENTGLLYKSKPIVNSQGEKMYEVD